MGQRPLAFPLGVESRRARLGFGWRLASEWVVPLIVHGAVVGVSTFAMTSDSCRR